MEFPLKVSDIVTVDSTAHLQVQIADIIGGTIATASKALSRGALQSGTFASDVVEICFAKQIIVDRLWPSHEIEPSKLGTDIEGGSVNIDLATYSAMILKGHPATKKDGK